MLDFSGMITAAYLAGNGENIDGAALFPSINELSQLPYSYNEPIKSDTTHKCVMIPIDPSDEIFCKPESSDEYEPPNQRN